MLYKVYAIFLYLFTKYKDFIKTKVKRVLSRNGFLLSFYMHIYEKIFTKGLENI